MSRFILNAGLALLYTATVGLSADPPKAEDQAKEAVEQFVKAVKSKDLDAVLKVADTPWFADQKSVIKDRDGLKEFVKGKLDKLKGPDQIPSQILRVENWEKFDRKDRMDAEQVKMADSVLGKTGFVVVLGRDGKEGGMILVRVEGGKAKVVGVAN